MNKELIGSYPEAEGMASEFLINFLNEAEKTGSEIHGIMFLMHGKVIFEAYNAPYAKKIPHIMHSFTKCLTNMALGLAYSRGLVALEAPVLTYLPEYAEGANEYLRAVTIEDLITMRSGQQRGIGGNEWRPLKSSWLDAYFSVPFVKQPGREFLYSSGNSYVLSAIVQRVTGKTCSEYLRETITETIGLSDFDWMLSPEGICSGGNGVSLTVEDMARIGLLYLNGGEWQGQQLLKAEWVKRSLGNWDIDRQEKTRTAYNYHWEHKGDIWASMGMFGQACVIVPAMDMVVAMTAADDKNIFLKILQEQIITPWKKQQRGILQENTIQENALQENALQKNVLQENALQENTSQDNGRRKCVEMKDILYQKGLRMTLESRNRSVPGHVQPSLKRYEFLPVKEIDGITEIAITFDRDYVAYEIRDERGCHRIKSGLDHWNRGITSMTGGYLHHQYEMDRLQFSACAYWQDESRLMMEWRYPEMAFFDHVCISWREESITVKRWVNMNSQDVERPLIEAVRKLPGVLETGSAELKESEGIKGGMDS